MASPKNDLHLAKHQKSACLQEEIPPWNCFVPEVYDELKIKARQLLSKYRYPHYQPTVLVHELYINFQNRKQPQWKNRRHFYAAVALTMRHIIINDYLRRRALKRGDESRLRITLADLSQPQQFDVDLLDLDRVLKKFERVDPKSCRILELRFFAGFTIQEIAYALDIHMRTVERRIVWSKAWIFARLEQTKRIPTEKIYDSHYH